MAVAANITEVVATTLRLRSKKIADNTLNHNAALREMNQRGLQTASGGRVITEPLMYGDNSTVDSYTEYENIDTTPQNVIDAAEYDWKQYAGSISMSGLERLKNTGKSAFLNWLDARQMNLEKSLQNRIATDFYSDGTTAKNIGGLRELVPDDPTTGTVGGINRATAGLEFWRSQLQNDQATVTSSNIQGEMNLLWLNCIRGTDKPNLILADTTYYEAYEASLQSNQRFVSDRKAGAGFEELVYKGGCRVVYDDQCPTEHMYFLNLDYLKFRPHVDENFVPINADGTSKVRQSVNQNAFVILFGFTGNLTMCNAARQGVLIQTA